MLLSKKLLKLSTEMLTETFIANVLRSIWYLKKFPANYIHFSAKIRNSTLDKFAAVHKDTTVINSRIGEITYIGPKCIVTNAIIGNYCSIAPGVVIGIVTHRNANGIASYEPNIKRGLNNGEYGPLFDDATEHLKHSEKLGRVEITHNDQATPTRLGNNVYIGQNSLIAEGIHIADNVIVGCNSFVNCDVTNDAIVAGNPAREIRT